MNRYTLLNDLTRAHRAHLLNEVRQARHAASTAGLCRLAAILRGLLLALA